MGSNGDWGELAKHDDELAEAWDGFGQLPDPGQNPALDAFLERKGISLPSLVRLGARMANGSVVTFAFPGGIKFRDLITDRRWSFMGSEFKALKIVRAGPEPTSTVIVAEGETDAAKLSDVYGVDVAVLPSGADARPHAARYAAQLEPYSLVLLGHDDDDAGNIGAPQLADLLPQAQRFMPPANDWCDTQDFPPLPEPIRILDRAGALIFEDLSALLTEGVPEPEVLVDDLLYTEGVHWINGHPGSGKTTLAMHMAIQVMAEARDVVWLDYEGGARTTVRRLLACQCPLELAVQRFHYSAWPGDAPASFADVAARWPGALIVLDSASKALVMAGLDENSSGDVTRWAAPIVKQCKEYHLPVVVIDHVTKVATRESRYGRGAGSKMADSDVAWFVDCLEPFNRERVGLIGVFQQKDREGYLPHAVWFRVGDGRGGLPLEPTDAPAEEPTDAGEPPI